MKTKFYAAALAFTWVGFLPAAAWSQVTVVDDFTQSSAVVAWEAFNGACLTAGGGGGTIPACVGLAYYGGETLVGGANGTLPDPVGQGALRFTNGFPGGYAQNGAIVLNPANSFPSSSGVQITFTTVTYRGDSGGAGHDGADGISFFLMDASQTPDLGAFGGSLGYTCSNTNNDPKLRADGTPRGYDGLVGAYLGLGIDEFGNFLNGSNPLTGYNGDNTASGYGYVPDRIGMRGAGNVAWRWLNNHYPNQYPTGLNTAQRASAVQLTCSTGVLWDYSGSPTNPVISATQPPANQPLDYPAIPNAFSVLTSVQIAAEAAMKRSDATPITYKLKITTDGLLSLSYSINAGAYLPVIAQQNITVANGPLPANFLFGFAGSTGGDTNIHEIMCFRAAPVNNSASSAGVNQQQAAKVQAGTQIYFAFYNPDTWAGSLTSQNILISGGAVTGFSTPNWDASCVLTGGACAATGAASGSAEAPTSRVIMSWNGNTGIPFEWNNLTTGATGQQATLDQGDPTPPAHGANRLNYLRGDRSNEQNAFGVGLYRARTSVLGDIIDSSPTWVGPASLPYTGSFADKIGQSPGFPENTGQSYTTFQTSGAQTRLNVVYTGANDGLLHGFEAGSYDASNNFVATKNDGYEVLAYMPGAIVNTIHNATVPGLDFSNPQYGHNYYVDATPGTGDLFYEGTWHTWVVGGLGAGGAAIYALDVTNPSNFAEGNAGGAGGIVIGEWSNTTLNCVNGGTGCAANLGNTYGVPQIRRFHNGQWGAVFGNGLGTANGSAGIFVMLVNSLSGTETFYYIGTSGTAPGNGIAYVTAADLDNDNITDFVYAGDVKGNIWRFDLTSSNPALWAASPTALFTTPNGQPITTQLIVASTPASSGPPRVMIDFGTGQQTPFTITGGATYASGAQSLYGIWDWNFSGPNGWNTKGSTQYASLPSPQTIVASGPSANLEAQTITTTGVGVNATRSVTSNPVCFSGSATCAGGTPANKQFGWELALPAANEQVIFSPILEVGLFIVNTTIPPSTSLTTCASTLPTGFTMAISPTTGGAFSNSVFADPTTGSFITRNISGVELNGTGSGTIVSSGGTGAVGSNLYFVTQTVAGSAASGGTTGTGGVSNGSTPTKVGAIVQIKAGTGNQGGRLTWIQRR